MGLLTEENSPYQDLEKMSVAELIHHINYEDKTVAEAVSKALPDINTFISVCIEKLQNGGRLFYIGAGSSGRLGILDASECPPTFGVKDDRIIGIIAGGDSAIRKAVENAEDDPNLAWKDLMKFDINAKDIVLGIAASGSTTYVVEGLKTCLANNIATGCLTCNPDSPITKVVNFKIVVSVGPEFLTGSTRMKAGTAQKMVLNMISTATMIKLGKVHNNKMIDMKLSNEKLVRRGTKMVMDYLALNEEAAKKILLAHGSVRKALEAYKKDIIKE